jgi:uncharacterized protein (TIGR02145 family)
MVFVFLLSTTAQSQVIEFTFTAIDSASYIQLDSIKVMNRTQGGDTVLYWNDTVLVLKLGVGFPDINSRKDGFQLQSFPNPLTDHATIEISIPEQGEVKLSVTDILGRQLHKISKDLHAGTHSYRFIPGNDRLYFLTATWNGYRRSIKIINSSQNPSRQCAISYQEYKKKVSMQKSHSSSSGLEFSLGDTLLYIGYVDTLDSGIPDSPDSNQTYTFQFAHNIPCPGTPTVTYEGQVYNTVQIFSQCWLKENLNIGTMISGDSNMTDNGIIEKYCYDNEEDSCDIYGGLYQWNEMMQYTTTQGAQGICPPGWHIPTDEEWKILEGAVDSKYGVGHYIWDYHFIRGFDSGKNLKSTTGWFDGGNGLNIYSFKVLPGGARNDTGDFTSMKKGGYFWVSTGVYNQPYIIWNRFFIWERDNSIRGRTFLENGFSVRCIKD